MSTDDSLRKVIPGTRFSEPSRSACRIPGWKADDRMLPALSRWRVSFQTPLMLEFSLTLFKMLAVSSLLLKKKKQQHTHTILGAPGWYGPSEHWSPGFSLGHDLGVPGTEPHGRLCTGLRFSCSLPPHSCFLCLSPLRIFNKYNFKNLLKGKKKKTC